MTSSSNYLQALSDSRLTTCTITLSGSKISLTFSTQPSGESVIIPSEPGVYVVYAKGSETPLYVGETRNLQQRLTFLFRCNSGENPHPFHKWHKTIHGHRPDVEEFCDIYAVRWITTTAQVGRIEIEEALQKSFGTNKKEFYLAYGSDEISKGATEPCTQNQPCNENCKVCIVWNVLSTDNKYQSPNVTCIPTLAGRGPDLLFSYDPATQKVRVWREKRSPDFTFDAEICRLICIRYQEGLMKNELPPLDEAGGTSYFGKPKWEIAELNYIKAPYAAAVIRHILRNHQIV